MAAVYSLAIILAQARREIPFAVIPLILFATAVLPTRAHSEESTENEPFVLQPVTVTARQVEEPLQKVPFAMTAVQRKDLRNKGIRETRDLFRSIPNFNYTDTGFPAANTLNMRGIGTSSTFLAPSITYYVDGVPIPQRVFDQRFLDVERIEVLRGPQGTLFGQNSQAGAVNIITANPGTKPEYELGVEYGRFDSLRMAATASGPLSHGVSGRLSGEFESRSGDIPNYRFSTTGRVKSRDRTIRAKTLGSINGKLVIEPDDVTSIRLSGYVRRDRRHPTTGVLLEAPDFPRNALDPRPSNDVESGGTALTIERYFGDTRFTSITGLQAYELALRADITDGFIASANSGLPPAAFSPRNAQRHIDENSLQWSQELRLDGETDAGIRWVGGLSGLYSDFESATEIRSPILPNGRYHAVIDTTNLAAFGEVTVPLTSRLRVMSGLRLTHVRTDFDGHFKGAPGGAPSVSSFSESGRTQDTFLTGRTGLSYDLSPQLTAFATIARGAKAGGYPFYNQSAAFGQAVGAYKGSSTWSYETGLRGLLFDQRLEMSTSIFFNDTRDEQLFIFNPVAGQFQVENADTHSYGTELELTARPSERLTLKGSLGLLKTSIREDVSGGSYKGNGVPYAPEVSGNLSAEYRIPAHPLEIPGNFLLGAEYQYVGAREIDPANSAQLDAYGLLHLRAGWSSEDVDVYAFARNLLDKRYAESGFLAGRGPDGRAVIGGVPGVPRMIGVGARIRF